MQARKVLLVEVNEVTWNLIDPLIVQGKLPTFKLLKTEGAWASPVSVDLPPQLDPWITWTTVYSGRPQSDHNVFFLQQPPDTIHAKRIWELCDEAGLSVGVYGSLCSWPPRKVKGFYIPDTFAPDVNTYPEDLEPIQQLNLTYTRSIRLPSDNDTLLFKTKLGAKLLALGLSPSTIATIVRQLARERTQPETRWKRVALQPLVNYDFFSRLYKRERPHYSSFHTNHVAHYMHTYWKAMTPEIFPQQTSIQERENFAGAIEHGYKTADELLRRMMTLLDDNTVMVVASSMGQKPFITPLKKGKRVGQLRSLDQLVKLLDLNGEVRALSTMSDQFNLYADSSDVRDVICERLKAVYIDTPDYPMFSLNKMENSVTATLNHYDETLEESCCVFPHRNGNNTFRFEDLVYGTGIVKSGCHDPMGVLMIYGPGISAGVTMNDCTTLDIAPTLMTVLGLPVPSFMKGRVLSEAFA